MVFLLNRPPSKTFGGDTSYNRMFDKHADRLFLWNTKIHPHGGRQAHLALRSRHTRSPYHLQSKQQLRAHLLQRHFIRHRHPGEGEAYIRKHALSIWRIIHFSAHIFCDITRALLLVGQGSYSSRSKHLARRFLGLRDWIMDVKLVIDHVSIKDQLSGIYLSRGYFWIRR